MIPSISLCLVVYNEAHRIYQTLENAYPHVDEIVIVNQSSTDDTVMRIGQFVADKARGRTPVKPVKVVRDKHWGFCEPSRKVAQQHSTGLWILVLDADERISDEFRDEMRFLDERGYRNCRLMRSLWLSGAHHFTGDYQHRFFHRDAVTYLDEIHTDPQPSGVNSDIYAPPYVGIWHEKSWTEQVRDERAYASLITSRDARHQEKLALNVHLKILEEFNMTAEEFDALPPEQRSEMLHLPEFTLGEK